MAQQSLEQIEEVHPERSMSVVSALVNTQEDLTTIANKIEQAHLVVKKALDDIKMDDSDEGEENLNLADTDENVNHQDEGARQ